MKQQYSISPLYRRGYKRWPTAQWKWHTYLSRAIWLLRIHNSKVYKRQDLTWVSSGIVCRPHQELQPFKRNSYHVQEYGLLYVASKYMKSHLRLVLQDRYCQDVLLFEIIHSSYRNYHKTRQSLVESDKNMILALFQNLIFSMTALLCQ